MNFKSLSDERTSEEAKVLSRADVFLDSFHKYGLGASVTILGSADKAAFRPHP